MFRFHFGEGISQIFKDFISKLLTNLKDVFKWIIKLIFIKRNNEHQSTGPYCNVDGLFPVAIKLSCSKGG